MSGPTDKDPLLGKTRDEPIVPVSPIDTADFQDQNPVGTFLKCLFIFTCCVYPLGSQSMYDSPAAMGEIFLQHYNMTTENFGFLYSMYALPNLVIVFMVGVLVDRIGPNWSGLMFNAVILGGATVMAYSDGSYPVLVGSFAFFGLGAASILVSQMAILTKWFKGSELALAFGFATSMLRAQSTADYNVLPYLAKEYGVDEALLIPWLMAIVSMGMTCLSFFLDHYRFAKARSLAGPQLGSWPKFSDLRAMGTTFWMLVVVCCGISMGDFLFEMYAVTIFQNDGESAADAGRATSAASVAIVFVTPLAAFIGDKFGHYAHMMIVGGLVECAACVLWMNDSNLPPIVNYVTSFLFGTGYSIGVAVVWASVALLVKDEVSGTAYGMMNGFLNLALFVLPYLMGFVIDQTDSYFYGKLVVLCVCMAAVVAGCMLMRIDIRKGGRLKDPKKIMLTNVVAASLDKESIALDVSPVSSHRATGSFSPAFDEPPRDAGHYQKLDSDNEEDTRDAATASPPSRASFMADLGVPSSEFETIAVAPADAQPLFESSQSSKLNQAVRADLPHMASDYEQLE